MDFKLVDVFMEKDAFNKIKEWHIIHTKEYQSQWQYKYYGKTKAFAFI